MHTYMQTYIRTHIHTFIHAYIHKHIYINIYTHIHTCMHTHMHIYIQACKHNAYVLCLRIHIHSHLRTCYVCIYKMHLKYKNLKLRAFILLSGNLMAFFSILFWLPRNVTNICLASQCIADFLIVSFSPTMRVSMLKGN